MGIELLHAALRGATLNVEANLASLTDEAFTNAVRAEVERLVIEGDQWVEAALASLGLPG